MPSSQVSPLPTAPSPQTAAPGQACVDCHWQLELQVWMTLPPPPQAFTRVMPASQASPGSTTPLPQRGFTPLPKTALPTQLGATTKRSWQEPFFQLQLVCCWQENCERPGQFLAQGTAVYSKSAF